VSIIWYPNPNHDSTLGMILCAQTILTLPIYICICRYDAAAAHYGTRGSLHSLNSRPTLTAADGCRSDYSTDGSSYQEGAVLNPMMLIDPLLPLQVHWKLWSRNDKYL